MPGETVRLRQEKTILSMSENAAPLLRELPSWLGLGVGLLSLATGLLALLLPFKHSPIAPLLLVGAAVSALAGGWILFHTDFQSLEVCGATAARSEGRI